MEFRWTSTPPNGCAADRRTPGAKEYSRAPGGLFFRGFLLAEQKKATQGAGRSHPQLAVEIARKAREPFKTWTPAFAGATPVSSLSRG